MIIANVEPDDEGVYTCQVITKLDMAEASNTLTLCGKTDHVWNQQVSEYTTKSADTCSVQVVAVMMLLSSPSDRPDPPVLLQITDPKHRAVTLSWTPGDDHKSPVLGLVQTHILTLRRKHLHTHLSCSSPVLLLFNAKTVFIWTVIRFLPLLWSWLFHQCH